MLPFVTGGGSSSGFADPSSTVESGGSSSSSDGCPGVGAAVSGDRWHPGSLNGCCGSEGCYHGYHHHASFDFSETSDGSVGKDAACLENLIFSADLVDFQHSFEKSF